MSLTVSLILQAGINDFTMFLYLNEQNQDYEELCEVHGLITISSYVIRHYEMTKKHLHAYNKYKGA